MLNGTQLETGQMSGILVEVPCRTDFRQFHLTPDILRGAPRRGLGYTDGSVGVSWRGETQLPMDWSISLLRLLVESLQ